jgi:hypothetical protein
MDGERREEGGNAILASATRRPAGTALHCDNSKQPRPLEAGALRTVNADV